jgi:mono/diheme cytochrome c family protein
VVPALIPIVICGGVAWCFGGCSTSSNPGSGGDAGPEDAAVDVAVNDTGPSEDSAVTDAGIDAPPTVTGMAIVSGYGTPLQAAPGDAVPLVVVFTLSDGTTQPLPTGTQVSWIAPQTVVAQDPYDAGPNSVIPDAGDQPSAFYIQNPYRATNPGVLFVVAAGTVADAGVTVTASLPDGGTLSAVVAILPAPVGDPDAGGYLFQQWFSCADCHGATAAGSPQAMLVDGGLIFLADGGPAYDLNGTLFPYPAPGLNNIPDSGNLATDPTWNAALLGMAAQSDIDNNGVALRAPMVNKLGDLGPSKKPVNGQDFANVYSWLLLQTQ